MRRPRCGVNNSETNDNGLNEKKDGVELVVTFVTGNRSGDQACKVN